MGFDGRIDPAGLFGRPVVDDSGGRLGRVIALIHHGDGCDVLLERRRWLRRSVVRLDVDDLVDSGDGLIVRHQAGRRASGPRDGWVA
jgi:hypothetical protein